MQLNDLKIAYDIVMNFKKYDTLSSPPKVNTLDYKVPKLDGIHSKLWGKNIDEVKLNTLEYILYDLHNMDEDKVISNLIALLYYWKIRKRKQSKMDEVYQEVVKHYTIQNKELKNDKLNKGKCVYLVKISIGSRTLYKIGKTEDIHQRIINLQSDIKCRYPLVSIAIDILEVKYYAYSDEIEKLILIKAKSKIIDKHKLNFKGSTEAFEDIELIDVFNEI